MNTTNTTPLVRRLLIAFARWAYWPDDPRDRAPLYVTAIVMLAMACADQTTRTTAGAAAFVFYWPVGVLLAAPIVRAALLTIRSTNPTFHVESLRRRTVIIAGFLCAYAIVIYVQSLSIARLDWALAYVTLPIVGLLVGAPIIRAALTGEQPGTRNYLGEVRAWIGSVPLFGGTAPQPHATNERPPQDIPWEDEEPPHTEPMPDSIAWAYGVLDLPQTATLDEAQAAYRRLAKERHPDQATNPADRIKREERMTRLNAAWELIEKHHGRP